MAFRVLMIESEVTIKLKLCNLIITKGFENDIWIPLDDISMIVIDNLTTSITTRLLSILAEEGIAVVICDRKHLPIGYYCSYDNHSRASKVFNYQLSSMTEELKSNFWKKIIEQKIINQRQTLIELGMGEEVADKLLEFSKEVEERDCTNREAHAAKVYFNTMMGTSFSRGDEDILLNSGLDYGYAIIRSYLARLCVGYGLNTQVGFFHRNEYNRFNLCDDLIEPIRPIVDLYAYRLLNREEMFKADHRHKLVNLLNHKIRYKNKKMYLCNMLEEYVEQVASMIMGLRDQVVFPEVVDYIGEEDEL